LTISWLAAALALCGAFEGTTPAASVAGRGGPDASRAGEGDPLEANPALAASLPGTEFGAGWTRPLDLDGIGLSALWARHRFPSGTALVARWRGLAAEDVYREDLAGLDLSQASGPIGLGAGLRAGRVEVEGRDLGHPLGWSAGGTIVPAARVRLGASWEDLSGLGADGLPQPWTFRAGISAVGADSGWNAQVGASRRQRTGWNWGIGQELVLPPLRLRLGLRLSPWVLSAGLGFSWKAARLDYALEGDPTLGFQHHWSVSWDP
jgi:hypothetical protein